MFKNIALLVSLIVTIKYFGNFKGNFDNNEKSRMLPDL